MGAETSRPNHAPPQSYLNNHQNSHRQQVVVNGDTARPVSGVHGTATAYSRSTVQQSSTATSTATLTSGTQLPTYISQRSTTLPTPTATGPSSTVTSVTSGAVKPTTLQSTSSGVHSTASTASSGVKTTVSATSLATSTGTQQTSDDYRRLLILRLKAAKAAKATGLQTASGSSRPPTPVPVSSITSGAVKPTVPATSTGVNPTISATSSGLKPTAPAASSGFKPTVPATSTSTGVKSTFTTASGDAESTATIPAPAFGVKSSAPSSTSSSVKSTSPRVVDLKPPPVTPTKQQSLYPDLFDDLVRLGREQAGESPGKSCNFGLKKQESIKRVEDWQKTSGPEDLNREDLPAPSCAHNSLLDAGEGTSGTDSSSKNTGTGTKNCSKDGNPFVFVTEDEKCRPPSPIGSECSRQSSASGNRPIRNRSKPRKPKIKPVDDKNEPPKYEDVIAQKKEENKNKAVPPRKAFQRQFTKGPQNQYRNSNFKNGPDNPLVDRWPKSVDFLNDLIKKEFGSVGEPTYNLPAVIDSREKLFSGRNCLFVGNLPPNITRDDVNELMAPYGEIVVDHHNVEKKFGFVRLKHREEAEKAQRNLDGYVFKGRTLRVRHANKNTCFKVSNLDTWVTNELLKKAFSAFGEVERAEIIVENGRPTGEGVLEFSEKRAGKTALEACVEHCFLLTSSLRPVILEEIKGDDSTRGYSEMQVNRHNHEYRKSREIGPRFLAEGTQENNCAVLWKSFYERKKREEEELAKKLKEEERVVEEQVRSMMSN